MNPSFKTRTSDEALDEHLQQLKASTEKRKQNLQKIYATPKSTTLGTPPTPPPPLRTQEPMRMRSDSTATSIYVVGNNSTHKDPYSSQATTLDRKQEQRLSWTNMRRRADGGGGGGGGSISAGSRNGIMVPPPITPSPQTTRSYISNITTTEIISNAGGARGMGGNSNGGHSGIGGGTISGRTTATSGRISSSGVTTISGSNNTLNDIHSDYHSQDVGAGSDFHNQFGVTPMKQNLSTNGSFNLANGSTVKLLTASDDESNQQVSTSILKLFYHCLYLDLVNLLYLTII